MDGKIVLIKEPISVLTKILKREERQKNELIGDEINKIPWILT